MKRFAIAVLALSILGIAIAYASAFANGAVPAWGAALVAVAISFAMISTAILGAARAGRPKAGLGRLAVPFLVTLLLVLGAFMLALVLPGDGEPILLGLPRRAAFILYGIGLLPVFVLPVAYAATFDESTLTEDDLQRVRDAAREWQEQSGSTPGE